MNYPYPTSPYMPTTMAQAMQALMTGNPLPPNCFVVAIPMEQAQQMFPQLMMNYVSGGSAKVFSQPSSYYGQLYQPQPGQYPNNQQSNALVPYSNYHSQGYHQNYNYPMVPYVDYNNQSKRKDHYGKNYRSEPHSNVYNSSSFDSHMNNLSWSRIFGRHHPHVKQRQHEQGAIGYEQKPTSSKQQQQQQQQQQTYTTHSLTLSSLTSTSSSSTTSDESIRRVTVSTKQPVELSSSKQQQTKGSLPFKYSSDFVPGNEKQKLQKSNRRDTHLKSDDVFFVKMAQQSQPSSKK
ncbi:unnamed protein product [Rotaria sordida]|uniref:Uncharacterized protein n=1 Tax=Rotaria sordida TaxID=392033 RepID=A0A813VH36_9BILA|nr:unnamed protein product [Rotaria sordida]CAF0895682.1 unnamed protein product [Rotaria sordida]CAF3481754.1 unnamed protein product [Rotaria sordida]CAF3565221.1 unnamed protein product [Rotaria sordida]